MTKARAASIREHFSELTDPRRREPVYPLMDMVIMMLSAVICGADDFVANASPSSAFKVIESEFFLCFTKAIFHRPSSEGDSQNFPQRPAVASAYHFWGTSVRIIAQVRTFVDQKLRIVEFCPQKE